jgi:uncharacterized protein
MIPPDRSVVEERARVRLLLKGRLARAAWTKAREAATSDGVAATTDGAATSLGGAAEYRDLAFRADQSLRHLAETLGLPACEIGEALIGGEAWPLELPPPDGSTVELRPAKEPVELGRRPRFLADAHLGRLSRILRLLGFDSLWLPAANRAEAIGITFGEERVLLTRDRGLLFERPLSRPAEAGAQAPACHRCMLVLSADPYRQTLEVSARFGLDRLWQPLSLCSSCGAEIEAAPKAEVLPFLPALVAARYAEFMRCPECGKVFWKGDHARSIEPLLARLRGDLARR